MGDFARTLAERRFPSRQSSPMPLYEFSCRACGTRFEARVPHGHRPACPECAVDGGKRLVSPFAGPFTLGLRGALARRSNALRHGRDEQRRERRELRRELLERGKE